MKNMTSHVLSVILKHLKSRPTFESVGVQQYRLLLDSGARVFKPDPSIEFTEFDVDHIHAAWLIPENPDPSRVTLFIHGGGFIAGSITSHRDLASRIAAASGTRTLLFEYRLAPEYPFPAGAQDVYHMLMWLMKNLPESTRINLVGDSAGGGLALGLLARLDRENLAMPSCTVLISPWIDLACQSPSHTDRADADPMLSQALLLKTARMYTDLSLDDPEVSPLHHRFQSLCPILIHVGKNEVLLDDSRQLAHTGKEAGADIRIAVYEDMFHVWHYFAKYLEAGRTAIDEIGAFIKSHG
ncbi:MAG: alpha/beta hydrolase [Desulfobacteraceae bacterium]|nr:MAG: alpha/beta hydrolase [Desulfobacteraceae bacterium]